MGLTSFPSGNNQDQNMIFNKVQLNPSQVTHAAYHAMMKHFCGQFKIANPYSLLQVMPVQKRKRPKKKQFFFFFGFSNPKHMLNPNNKANRRLIRSQDS